MKLTNYIKKRDFTKTKEPKGELKPKQKVKAKEKTMSAKTSSKEKTTLKNETVSIKRKKPIFVVQEHDATRLHYDFRIEMDGVLKSWAVPNGIPTQTAEKHLAVETEDHPMKYASFEGKIPKGEYGAGTVKIWDKGNFRNIRKLNLKESYLKGQIEISLDGTKLKGNYALINTKFNDNKKNWLIIKMRDNKYDFDNG